MQEFIHDIRGNNTGAEWQITNGTDRFEFTTNWKHKFSYTIENYKLDNIPIWQEHLDTLLTPFNINYKLQTNTTTTQGGKGSIDVEMEREDFEKIREELKAKKLDGKRKKSELDRFQTEFTHLINWEFERYEKLDISDELKDFLQRQNKINNKIIQLKEYLISLDHRAELEAKTAKQTYEQKGTQGVLEWYTQHYEGKGKKPLPKKPREAHKSRLEELVENTPSQKEFQKLEHRRIAVMTVHKAATQATEHQAKIATRSALKKPESANDKYSRELATEIVREQKSLEKELEQAGHRLDFRDKELIYRSHLHIMNRVRGIAKLDGIQHHRDEQGKRRKVSAEEFLGLNKAYFDIEKPQYDTWMEVIAWCGTLIEYSNKQIERVLDTNKNIPWEEIDGYKVRVDKFEHHLTKNVANMIQDAYLLFVYNANYEAFQMRNEGNFVVGRKTPRKRASVPAKKSKKERATARVDGKQIVMELAKKKNDFMARWELAPFTETIDWMKYAKITKQHLPVHGLEMYMNHQAERAGAGPVFEKIIDYVQMRVLDQWAMLLEHPKLTGEQRDKALSKVNMLAQYTVSDVEVMYNNMQFQVTINDFIDVVDTAQTFGVSLSQVTNNANTVRIMHDKKFYERFGFHNDQGFFRELHRKEIQKFKEKYTQAKITTFKESGLNIQFRKGMHKGVDMYYFSPELLIMEELQFTYPEVAEYADRTMALSDAERQMGRLQYVRSFLLPVLADHNTLRRQARLRPEEVKKRKGKKKEEKSLQKIVEELQARASRQSEKNKLLQKGWRREDVDDAVKEDHALLQALNPLHTFFAQDENSTRMPELRRLIGALTQKYEQGTFETYGIEDRICALEGWNNRLSFFQKQFGIDAQRFENKIFDIYENIVEKINESGVEVLQAEGKFLYIKGELDKQEALERGLIKVEENMTILNTGTSDLIYQNRGYYKKSKKPRENYHRSRFEKEVEFAVLDATFAQDYKAMLQAIAKSSNAVLALGPQTPLKEKNKLFRHNRGKGVFLAYKQGEEKPVEISELDKDKFELDYTRHQEELITKRFGLGKKFISRKGDLSKLVHAQIPLVGKHSQRTGHGNHIAEMKSGELYRELVTTTDESLQEELIEELLQDYRRRDFASPQATQTILF